MTSALSLGTADKRQHGTEMTQTLDSELLSLRLVHSTRTDLRQIDPVTRHVATRSLVTRVSVTTLLAAAKLGLLVLGQFWAHVGLLLCGCSHNIGVHELQLSPVHVL